MKYLEKQMKRKTLLKRYEVEGYIKRCRGAYDYFLFMFAFKESEVLRWEIVKLKEDLKCLEEKEEKDNKDKQGLW